MICVKLQRRKKIHTLVSLLFFAFFFCACSQKEKIPLDEIQKGENVQKRTTNDKILLFLGEGYSKNSQLLEYIKKEYGLFEKNSTIRLLIYDDLLVEGKDIQASKIRTVIEEHESSIVIAIGLPEGTGKHLIAIKEANPHIIIISVFAMEEVLFLEAACSLVVDFEQVEEGDAISEEGQGSVVSDKLIELVFLSALFAGEDIKGQKIPDSKPRREIFENAFKLASLELDMEKEYENYVVKPTFDAESNIPSYNFLMLHKKTN